MNKRVNQNRYKPRSSSKPQNPKKFLILALIILVVLLVSLGGFALGRLSALEEKRHDELRIIGQKTGDRGVLGVTGADVTPASDQIIPLESSPIKGVFVGSRSGKVYYFPWCAGVKRIHDENKVWFSSREDAEAKGYQPSTSCKGM